MQNFKSTRIIFILVSALLLVGCARNSVNPSDQYAYLQPANDTLGINNIRFTALKDSASTIAAQAGLSWRSDQINLILEKKGRDLDHIFNFNALMLDDNVLPPVLVEARYTLNLADNNTIRLSDRDYRILAQARFTTAPPNWRDYLWLSYCKPETPNASLLPKTKAEQIVWRENVRIGWNEGVQQANEIFSANLNRLRRDYDGMILYRKLYAQKIVSAPYVAKADLGVTGDGNSIHINDRVLRITALPQLQPDSKKWKPIIAVKKRVKTCAEKRDSSYQQTGDSSLRNLLEKLP